MNNPPKLKFKYLTLEETSDILSWTLKDTDNILSVKEGTLFLYPELKRLTKEDNIKDIIQDRYNDFIKENNNLREEYTTIWNEYNDKYMLEISNYFNIKWPKEYNYNSMNKVYRLNEIFKDNNDIIILDKTNNTKGLYTYNTFLLAGDTLWYKPVTLVDKLYNYPMQNDSRFILSELSKKDKIQKLHNDSISWYNNLPNDIDLIITHVPPFRNKSNSRGNNSCYYTEVKEYKSPVWIYGHDHKEEDIIINNTRLVSNPWGYDTKDFKIKTLTLTK